MSGTERRAVVLLGGGINSATAPAIERMTNLVAKSGMEGHQRLRSHTPLIPFSKAEIIRSGLSLEVDYGSTSICYEPLLLGEAGGYYASCQLPQGRP
ncbi:7-cyano-7-deazaguanine synthase [Myxococcus sp. Y35]|uniref:7-cyano-7-deazaguanine synthase n=1 Tax=Pseudomyxococcus flavus TaxID=3115648 RepID=UPI003CEE5FFF